MMLKLMEDFGGNIRLAMSSCENSSSARPPWVSLAAQQVGEREAVRAAADLLIRRAALKVLNIKKKHLIQQRVLERFGLRSLHAPRKD